MEYVAFESAALATYPTRVSWDSSAAELVQVMLDRWHLTAGAAYVGGETASALRVTTQEGHAAVLKVAFPHAEAAAEPLALEAWGPNLCPRVLRQDSWTWSILLECIEPGIPMSHFSTEELSTAEGLEIAADLLARLIAVPVPAGIPTLADVVGTQLADAQARLPHQRAELERMDVLNGLERAFDDAATLIDSGTGRFFLHGDFNPGNLLRESVSGRQRWVVIDPKPMRGDREYDLWPLVEQLGSLGNRSDAAIELAQRLRFVSQAVGCDYARSVRWGVVRAALSLTWLIGDGNLGAAEEAARRLNLWQRVSEL